MKQWKSVTLGPVALPDGQFVMRTPRLADGPAWSAARLANREWLERAFPAWGDDWAAEQSEIAWAQRWWRLRAAALRGRAMPFVLFVDGRLVGELGVDAVESVSASGEGSVWMVRDHGSAAVMNTASVLLTNYSFTCATPLDRMISPVATAARKGRSPGLSAVGLRIEGTVARKVGQKGMVDHDIWVLHNTAGSRARLAALVAALPMGPSATTTTAPPAQPSVLARAATRAAAREARSALRRLRPSRDGRSAASRQAGPQVVSLRALSPAGLLTAGPSGVRRAWTDLRRAPTGTQVSQILRAQDAVGTVWTSSDPGTATYEISATTEPGVDSAVLRAALELALGAAPPGNRPAIRVPLDRPDGAPGDELLRGLGLAPVATFAGNPEGRSGWPGEQRWEPADASTHAEGSADTS